uniref:Uncharacterized protein n=1 Tax=Oryza brachyantha TaxID=4533 RepID=J3NCU6_ORYBR
MDIHHEEIKMMTATRSVAPILDRTKTNRDGGEGMRMMTTSIAAAPADELYFVGDRDEDDIDEVGLLGTGAVEVWVGLGCLGLSWSWPTNWVTWVSAQN